MKQIIAVILMIGLVSGCSQRRGMATEEQEPAIERQAAPPSPLVALIGMKWDVVWKRLSSDGVTILASRTADDGTVEHILQNHEKRFGNVRLFVKDGVIDEVEAWAVNAMAPYFSTVAGVIQPDVAVEKIEKEHGQPVYVEYGHHGLRMKGWKVEDYLVFVESNNGMKLAADAGRVYAFKKGHLPSAARMWSLKGKTTLEALLDGKTHIEGEREGGPKRPAQAP